MLPEYPIIAAAELHDAEQSYPSNAREVKFSGTIIDVVSEKVRLPGTEYAVRRDYVIHPGAVVVVPLRKSEAGYQVLMIRQYRHPVAKDLWEFPAGLLDIKGEDYLAAAQRELREETDLQAQQWNVLCDYYASPGGHTESVRIFLARELSAAPELDYVRQEEEALLTWAWVDLEDAVRAAMAGRIHNPNAVIGALAAKRAADEDFSHIRPAAAAWMR